MDETELTEEPYRAGYSPKTDLKAVNALMKRNKYFRGNMLPFGFPKKFTSTMRLSMKK